MSIGRSPAVRKGSTGAAAAGAAVAVAGWALPRRGRWPPAPRGVWPKLGTPSGRRNSRAKRKPRKRRMTRVSTTKEASSGLFRLLYRSCYVRGGLKARGDGRFNPNQPRTREGEAGSPSARTPGPDDRAPKTFRTPDARAFRSNPDKPYG